MLEIAVFFCGAIVMVYEIAGSRVVAPHFGTSIYVWTSLIGVILASLSLGYWLGGRIADKNPSFRILSFIILFAAALIGLTTFVKEEILQGLSIAFSGMMARTLLTALLLFAPASIFLGMVSPYAVRLKLISVKTSGRTVGNLYAISTLGSIFGTFLAGFFLIPWMGTQNILLLIGSLLVLIAAALNFSYRKNPGSVVTPAILLLVFGGAAYLYNTSEPNMIEVDTRYNKVQIFDTEYWITGEPIKVMKVNNEYSSAAYHDSDALVYEYLQFFRLAEHFKPGFEKALMLGGAAYSFPVYYLNHYPHAQIDVVEIDPGLTQLAKEHFGLKENERMHIYHEDARTFLNKQSGKYEVIYGDAYKSLMAIPFQLTSLEAAQKKYTMLEDNGILIENIIASLEGVQSEFLQAELHTLKQVFPQTFVFACHDPDDTRLLQSISLVALKSGTQPALHNADPSLQAFLNNLVEINIAGGTIILTDDYAPVEYFAMRAL